MGLVWDPGLRKRASQRFSDACTLLSPSILQVYGSVRDEVRPRSRDNLVSLKKEQSKTFKEETLITFLRSASFKLKIGFYCECATLLS